MKVSGTTVLVITLAIQALVAAAALTVPVLAPVLGSAAGVGAELVGVYVALVYAGAMVGSLSASGWVARLGAMRASQAGLALCALGLLCSVSGQLWLLALGAVLVGVGCGPITPASSHLLIRTTPPHRMAFVFSLKQTGVPLGGVLAGLFAPKMEIACDRLFRWLRTPERTRAVLRRAPRPCARKALRQARHLAPRWQTNCSGCRHPDREPAWVRFLHYAEAAIRGP